MTKPIILASQSARRRTLLEWAEIPFENIIRGTDESYPDGLLPHDIAIHIALQKALAVQAYVQEAFHHQYKDQPILAADTIVVLDERIIGKPDSRTDAIETLTALQGRTHQVITGVALVHQSQQITFADVTEVSFHPLSLAQIEFYIDKYQPYDKAGSYAIQEWIGVVGIKSIIGDFYNVMGLPVSRVVQALKQLQY